MPTKKGHYKTPKAYQQALERGVERDQEKRLKVLEHYGGSPPKCKKCGFSDIRALCLDHANGGGRAERKRFGRGTTLVRNLIRNEEFPEGYQVLCANCNLIKAFEEGEFGNRT